MKLLKYIGAMSTLGVTLGNAAPATAARVVRSYATCYNLVGTMADGSDTRPRSVASNALPLGTRIRLVGRQSFHGYRRFVVRDTGDPNGPMGDGHIDIWNMGYSCSSWGVRSIRYKIGWRKLRTRHYLARRVGKGYYGLVQV